MYSIIEKLLLKSVFKWQKLQKEIDQDCALQCSGKVKDSNRIWKEEGRYIVLTVIRYCTGLCSTVKDKVNDINMLVM